MLKSGLYCFYLFLRASRLPGIRELRFIVVFSLYDPMLPFYLGDNQVRHTEPVLLLYPIPDLLICSPLPKSGHVHVFE